MAKNNVDDVVMIPMDKLIKAPWNAQEESAEIFNHLVDEIEAEGFDEPLLVITHPDKKDSYLICAGNHRYDAAKLNGMDSLPCIVKDWDEATAKIKSIQRNRLHGQPDYRKEKELINQVKDEKALSDEELAKSMAFKTMDDFYSVYNEETEAAREAEMKEAYSHDDISKELGMVDNLSTVLNDIFSQYEGSTIERSFMFFMHKKKLHLMVTCDDKLSKTLKKAVEHINNEGLDATEYFNTLLEDALKKS